MRITNIHISCILFLLLISIYSFAQNNCADSSFRYSLSKANHNIIPALHATCADLSLLIAGMDVDKATNDTTTFLTKLNSRGEIVWQIGMQAPNFRRIQPFQLKETPNGEIVISGLEQSQNPLQHRIVLLKFSSEGTLIWHKRFEQTLILSEELISVFDIHIAINGDIVFSAAISHIDLPFYSLLCRLNKDGAIIWSRAFNSDDTSHEFFGISVESDHLVVFARFIGGPGICNTTDVQRFSGMKIDINDGNLIDQKTFCLTVPHAALGYNPNAYAFTFIKRTNGNYVISGKQFGQGTYIKKDYVSLEFDNGLAFVKGKIITSALLPVGNIRTSELGYTVITVPIVADNVLYYGLIDPEGNFITRRKLTFEAGMEILTTTANAKTLHFKPDQSFVFTNTIKSGPDLSAQVFNLNPASPPGECAGQEDPFATVVPVDVMESSWNWTSITSDVLTASNFPVSILPLTIDKQSICKQKNSCDSIRIQVSDTLCMNFQDKILLAKRNAGCNKKIGWEIDPQYYEVIKQLNDTSIQVRFKNPAVAVSVQIPVRAFLEDCPTVEDTRTITLIHSGTRVPADITICEGDTIDLTYGDWFSEYTWQDGSKSAIYRADKPGRYVCMVRDYCGEIRLGVLTYVALKKYSTGFTDTTACPEQPVTLRPAGGLQSYSWVSDPGLAILNDSTAITRAKHSAKYYFEGKSSEGCAFNDTVQVYRWPIPNVSLGGDTAICAAEDVTLSAQQGFQSYLWNTGANSSSITVKMPGMYSVAVLDANGCVASDTIFVKDRGCISSVVFPSAFTPDNNGKNDFFKPAIFGTVKSFDLQIFNRWGQSIYQSKDARKGWDGSIYGQQQASGTYVYVCSYQFEGQEKKVTKGSIVLVR